MTGSGSPAPITVTTGANGEITVCFGDQCVKVACQSGEGSLHGDTDLPPFHTNLEMVNADDAFARVDKVRLDKAVHDLGEDQAIRIRAPSGCTVDVADLNRIASHYQRSVLVVASHSHNV